MNQLLKFYEMYKLRVENILFSLNQMKINICLGYDYMKYIVICKVLTYLLKCGSVVISYNTCKELIKT